LGAKVSRIQVSLEDSLLRRDDCETPITSASMTTNGLTTNGLTTKGMTTKALTSSKLTTAPLTTAPLTTAAAPVTSTSSSGTSVNGWMGQATMVVDQNEWGYCATINIKNTGTASSARWKIKFTKSSGTLTNSAPWSCTTTVSGSNYDLVNLNWNNVVNAGATYSGVGFCGSGQFAYSNLVVNFNY